MFIDLKLTKRVLTLLSIVQFMIDLGQSQSVTLSLWSTFGMEGNLPTEEYEVTTDCSSNSDIFHVANNNAIG